MTTDFILYGANGYTGRLVARIAAERGGGGGGARPVLAGRNAEEVGRLARELNFEHRVFSLDDAGAVDAALDGATVVLHCAGPFSRTSKQMADACLRTRTHYLDITGEIAVFESLAARDPEARSAGVMLLPGVGFDVVPSDCLAAHLKRRLPSATRLALGIKGVGRISRGTATTMTENIGRGGAVRRGGKIVPVPAAWHTREIDFGKGPEPATTIPWGDVSTAFHSTGISDVEVYAAMPASMRLALQVSHHVAGLLSSPLAQRYMKSRIKSGPPGPSDEERARGRSVVWGEAADADGNVCVSRLTGPEGYTLTAHTALAAVARVLGGDAPAGFQTPSRAYGADFIMEIEGVTREDL